MLLKGFFGGILPRLIARVICDYSSALAAIINPSGAGDDIIGNDGPPNRFAELDLWFLFPKFATTHQQRPTVGLQSMAAFLFVVPLHKRAVAESHGALPGDFSNLIARAPKRAVHKPHTAGIRSLYAHHGGVRPVERDEFTVGDQQGHRRAVLDHHGRETVIGAKAQEVAVANPGLSLNELVTDAIAEAEGVEDVLPVAAADDECFPMFLLPLKQFRFHAPPGIEMHILDAPDVVDGIHENTAAKRLAMDIADEMPLVLAGVDAVVGIQ